MFQYRKINHLKTSVIAKKKITRCVCPPAIFTLTTVAHTHIIRISLPNKKKYLEYSIVY